MATVQKKKVSGFKKWRSMATKENVAKALAAVGVVGLSAAIFAKRDKVKEVLGKVVAKVKKTSDKKAS